MASNVTRRGGRVDQEWNEKYWPVVISSAGRLQADGVDVILLLNPYCNVFMQTTR